MNLSAVPNRNVKVSVCVVSYNQRGYIRECLSSLVSQEANFAYEIIVGDDASTDGTREVVTEFVDRFPDLIIPVLHRSNIGPVRNYFSVHERARGKYVCHMDGDDVAFPKKLQKQADFLDADRAVNVLWHRMRFFNDCNIQKDHPDKSAAFIGSYVNVKDLLLYGYFGMHSSIMYRRENFTNRYENFDALDWLFSIGLMGDKFGFMLREVLGGYRVHRHGMSGGAVANKRIRSAFCKCQIELLKRYPEYASVIALRALFLAGLDFFKIRPYFFMSLLVFLRCRSFPALNMCKRLFYYYRLSHLPEEFK